MKEPGQLACEASGGNWKQLGPEAKATWARVEEAVRADEAAKHEAQVAALREVLQTYSCDCTAGDCAVGFRTCGAIARAALEGK